MLDYLVTRRELLELMASIALVPSGKLPRVLRVSAIAMYDEQDTLVAYLMPHDGAFTGAALKMGRVARMTCFDRNGAVLCSGLCHAPEEGRH